MHFLSRPRRPRRSGEWTSAKAVTFIVTLAATRSVTLAAHEAGMSRKSAYVLKARDPAFASAWAAAVTAAARKSSQGDKVEEVEGPPIPPTRVHMSPSRMERERDFTALIASLRESPEVAPRAPAQ